MPLKRFAQLNWTEVYFTFEPVEVSSKKRKIETKVNNGYCPSSHPYAFKNGKRCCQTNLETKPTTWVPSNYEGLLRYNSDVCYGKTEHNEVSCPFGKCINKDLSSYACYGGNSH